MKKSTTWTCLCVCLALVCGSCTGSNPAVFQKLLDASVHKSHGWGGGVVRIESAARGVLWQGASGNRVDGQPMATDDSFEVASVTKTFTATCVMMLVEDGRLRLDEPIGDVLPPKVTSKLLVVGSHDYGPEITVRQLLGHTSGLPDYWTDPPLLDDGDNAFVHAFLEDEERLWEPQEILAFVRKLRPIALPGERYHYGDSGYVLLGLVVEHLSGKKLHEVMRERILDPLKMTDTYFSYYEPPQHGTHESHRYERDADLYGQRRQSAEWAAGGLVSSTRDLCAFVLALAQGKLVKPATLDAMMAWTPTGTRDVAYGLGVFRITLDGGRGHLWGHDGHGNAFMYYWPERRIALVGTLNQTENDWWDFASAALKRLATSS